MNAPQAAPRRPGARFEVLAWCGAAAYAALMYVVVLNTGDQLTGMRLLPPLLLAVLLLPPLLRRRPLAVLAVLAAVSFGVTVTADSMMAAGTPPVLYAGEVAQSQAWQIAGLQAVLTDLVAWLLAATRGRRVAGAAAVLALGLQAGAASYYRDGASSYLGTVAFLALMMLTAWTVGRSVRERREHAAALRATAAEQAVTAERLRIARELHDMVAHSIGVIAIQAGVGRRVIDTQPAEARSALTVIEDTSRDTLAGLRRMLGALRRSDPAAPLGPAPGLADLGALVERTRDAGVRVDVEWRGERRALPADIELSAYRIVQEAVTNVVRHSGTDACRVTLDCREDELTVEITDEGRGGAGPAGAVGRGLSGAVGHGTPGAVGYGLTGMRERAALLHGEFTAGPRPQGGFRVAARLPVPAVLR
ncbi:sensor histidine kinase [Streptomyces sp. NPDC051940]|uniref:sensor histidine kinase n=1 Tax=Streptomyces sp. NPDC051940 TaxID=3155675 RepID=UPI003426E361